MGVLISKYKAKVKASDANLSNPPEIIVEQQSLKSDSRSTVNCAGKPNEKNGARYLSASSFGSADATDSDYSSYTSSPKSARKSEKPIETIKRDEKLKKSTELNKIHLAENRKNAENTQKPITNNSSDRIDHKIDSTKLNGENEASKPSLQNNTKTSTGQRKNSVHVNRYSALQRSPSMVTKDKYRSKSSQPSDDKQVENNSRKHLPRSESIKRNSVLGLDHSLQSSNSKHAVPVNKASANKQTTQLSRFAEEDTEANNATLSELQSTLEVLDSSDDPKLFTPEIVRDLLLLWSSVWRIAMNNQCPINSEFVAQNSEPDGNSAKNSSEICSSISRLNSLHVVRVLRKCLEMSPRNRKSFISNDGIKMCFNHLGCDAFTSKNFVEGRNHQKKFLISSILGLLNGLLHDNDSSIPKSAKEKISEIKGHDVLIKGFTEPPYSFLIRVRATYCQCLSVIGGDDANSNRSKGFVDANNFKSIIKSIGKNGTGSPDFLLAVTELLSVFILLASDSLESAQQVAQTGIVGLIARLLNNPKIDRELAKNAMELLKILLTKCYDWVKIGPILKTGLILQEEEERSDQEIKNLATELIVLFFSDIDE